jgi:hypothetical protein
LKKVVGRGVLLEDFTLPFCYKEYIIQFSEGAIMRSLEAIQNERKEILRKTLGEKLFDDFKKYIEHLFVTDDEQRPLDKRAYIFIARKGFILFHLAVSCGLTKGKLPTPDSLISNRNWRKMTAYQRAKFVNGKHVFIADDSIISSNKVYEVYVDIDVSKCKTRSVVVLSSDDIYSYELMFEKFEHFIKIDKSYFEERYMQHSKFMSALFSIPIAFTADSPSLFIQDMPYDELEKWKCLKDEKNGWEAEKTLLEFPHAENCETAFIMNASIPVNSSANVRSQGIRICYRRHTDGKYADVSLVPWIIFDMVDYKEAIKYLKNIVKKIMPNYKKHGDWRLYKQLEKGENDRKRIITHRVLSYIADDYILNRFKREVAPYLDLVEIKTRLRNEDSSYCVEEYHYKKDMLNDMHKMCALVRNVGIRSKYSPYSQFNMKEDTHEEVRSGLLKSHFDRIDVEDGVLSADELKAKLFGQREWSFDYIDKRPNEPVKGFRHPVMLCKGENSGTELLNLVRRAIASFNADIISHKDKMYLINTLYPGEGNYIPCYENLEFVWGLHHIDYCGYYEFDSNIEERFADYWNNNEESCKFPRVSKLMASALKKKSPIYWVNRDIARNHLDGKAKGLRQEIVEITNGFIKIMDEDKNYLSFPIF